MQQPKTSLNTEQSLPVMEHFCTIQGEGAFTGRVAYFIRLGGCDVGCVWCDVKESWPMENHPLMTIDDMVDAAEKSGAEIVVITGGEPTLHNLEALTTRLRERGLRTHIETSGTNRLTGTWHWVCFSPKKFKAPVDTIYGEADELKVVVFNKSDLAWAETHAERVNDKCLLFLQPEWGKREAMMPVIVDYCKKHPRWRISLQTHKYLDIP